MRFAAAVICCAVLVACSRLAGGPTLPAASSNASESSRRPDSAGYLSLYSFKGEKSGGEPQSELVNINGTLYGTSSSYGAGFGTVFAISPFGKLRVLHEFQNYPDGAYPQAGLTAVHGTLYGTTVAGGTHAGGTVFSVTRSGTEHVVYNFGKKGDGSYPESKLIAVDGLLYGTTLEGGMHQRGTVFETTLSGNERVLHSFEGAPSDGGHPGTGLILVKNYLYGTTRAGGKTKTGGTVYRINAIGQEKVLHAFGVERGDGHNPAGGLLYSGGILYGTTLHGGKMNQGVVFEMTAAGSERVLHSFGSGDDGAFPVASLTPANHALYGTTLGGGVSPKRMNQCISPGVTHETGYYRCGTIFKIDRFGTESVIYRFGGDPDGANPEAGLLEAGGVLYGTTFWGGSDGYYGTVFRLLP
jgi:uncharacterized repeat protein (TIGR03803 family)